MAKMGIDQFVEFQTAVLRSLPREADADVVQGWITNQASLADTLAKALLPTESDSFDITKYELVPFVEDRESCVSGDTMLDRAREAKATTGEKDAQKFLVNQHKIPVSYRKFTLVFPEVRLGLGHRGVTYLYWSGGRWCLRWSLVTGDWFRHYRLVRLCA